MNVLFYLTPKCDCAYIEDSDTLRQALEKMEHRRYSAIPMLNDEGRYIGIYWAETAAWRRACASRAAPWHATRTQEPR